MDAPKTESIPFAPSRLKLARLRRRLTLAQLAKAIELTTRRLSDFERGEAAPSSDVVARLAVVLKFPPAFFFAPELELFADTKSATTASFRAQHALLAKDRRSVLAAGTLATLVAGEVGRRFPGLPKWEDPDLGYESAPSRKQFDPRTSRVKPGTKPRLRHAENAADELRRQWGLGTKRIGNTIHLLESRGVRVFALAESLKEIDAFCFWRGKVPFVVLNTFKSGERGRFDAMHELGHLVLHREEKMAGRRAEAEANRFASAFLLPREAFLLRFPRTPDLVELLKAKREWGVSVQAMVRRGFDLGVYTEWQYKEAFIHMSSLGWRRQEPGEPEPFAREESKLFAKVFSSKKSPTSLSDLARAVAISPTELRALLPIELGDGDKRDGELVHMADYRRKR